MMLRIIVNAGFVPLVEAFCGYELDQIEMLKDNPCNFLRNNVVEKCYNSIVGFISFYDWFIHDVGFSYISQNQKLNEEQKLTLVGFKPSINPDQKPKYEKIDESSKKIIRIISEFEIEDEKIRKCLFNDFCNEKTKLKPFLSLRNKLVHGSTFEVGDEFIIDEDIDIVEYYKDLAPKYGLSYNDIKTAPFNMEFLSVNVNLTIETAYELSKQVFLTLKSFWKACFKDTEYKHLERLDYVDLIKYCDVKVPEVLKRKLIMDFPEKFTQSSPPSASQ